ncbi:hypothetical protein EK21DRAFT_93378 [Setomelanomma holmii]|uniref:Uncharacterized protein n=1 Tax=Setomelanomma holmii TaxID=210430 RepID=A0A9P4GYJ8_9PLEO|nr:hypothetical protein EK21DRAFT_93378 [Setomelanomma holmii]
MSSTSFSYGPPIALPSQQRNKPRLNHPVWGPPSFRVLYRATLPFDTENNRRGGSVPIDRQARRPADTIQQVSEGIQATISYVRIAVQSWPYTFMRHHSSAFAYGPRWTHQGRKTTTPFTALLNTAWDPQATVWRAASSHKEPHGGNCVHNASASQAIRSSKRASTPAPNFSRCEARQVRSSDEATDARSASWCDQFRSTAQFKTFGEAAGPFFRIPFPARLGGKFSVADVFLDEVVRHHGNSEWKGFTLGKVFRKFSFDDGLKGHVAAVHVSASVRVGARFERPTRPIVLVRRSKSSTRWAVNTSVEPTDDRTIDK